MVDGSTASVRSKTLEVRWNLPSSATTFFELLYQPHLTKSPQLRQARTMTRTLKKKKKNHGREACYRLRIYERCQAHTPTHIARQPFFEWRCNTKREARAAFTKVTTVAQCRAASELTIALLMAHATCNNRTQAPAQRTERDLEPQRSEQSLLGGLSESILSGYSGLKPSRLIDLARNGGLDHIPRWKSICCVDHLGNLDMCPLTPWGCVVYPLMSFKFRRRRALVAKPRSSP